MPGGRALDTLADRVPPLLSPPGRPSPPLPPPPRRATPLLAALLAAAALAPAPASASSVVTVARDGWYSGRATFFGASDELVSTFERIR